MTASAGGDSSMGRRIASARGWCGWTQAELAGRMAHGHSGAWLANIELGKRRITASDVHELSALLGVPVSYLFGDVEAFLSETGVRFDAAAARLSEADLDTVARLVQRLAQDRVDHQRSREGT